MQVNPQTFVFGNKAQPAQQEQAQQPQVNPPTFIFGNQAQPAQQEQEPQVNLQSLGLFGNQPEAQVPVAE